MERSHLVRNRQSIVTRLQSGCDFFDQVTPRSNPNDVKTATKMMREYFIELQELDRRIFELDTIIGSRLEAEFLDSVIRIRAPKTSNDAGDAIGPTNFTFMPEGYTEDDYATIDEKDLWFLKIIKTAFSLKNQNVEIIKKGRPNAETS